jgi:hypothetical protein
MSHEDIMTLYTTYFASNKRDTNELNGCLGLGSKSPFAYTSQFWVTAYKDGKKRHYVATADVSGPRFDQYPTCDSNEDDGFEIGFTVKEDDFGRFRDTAEEVYKYFKTQPDVEGVDFEHLEPEEEKLSGSFWKYIGKHITPIAIMGNIGYPIESSYFEDEDAAYWERRSNKYSQILLSGIHINFDIGELSMTASREGLEYKDEVIQAIKDKIDTIYAELQASIDAEFADCDCLYDARVKLSKYSNSLSSLDSFVFPKWQGKEGKEIEVRTTMSLANDCKVSVQDFTCHYFTYNNKPKMKRDHNQVAFGDNFKIFFNDMATGGQAATKYYIENNTDKSVFLFQNASDETLTKLCVEFGIDESRITKTSELEKRPKTAYIKGTKKRKVEADCFEFDGEANSYHHTTLYDGRYWKPATKNLSDGQDNVYVELYRYSIMGFEESSSFSPRTLNQFKRELAVLGIEMPEVYGFPSGKAKRVKKAKNWIHFTDWAKAKFNEYMDSSDIASMIQKDNVMCKMNIAEGIVLLSEHSKEPLLDGYFKKVSDTIIKIKKESCGTEEHEAIIRAVKCLAGLLNSSLPEFSTEQWNQREERIIKKYPVLQVYDLGYIHRLDEEDATAIIKCINDTEIARAARNLV